MSSQCVGFQGPLASEMRAFVDGKRTLGRRYLSEEKQLRIFDAFLVQHGLTSAADVTPEVIGTFLASLSRPRPRSYNEMLGVVRRLFEWLVRQGRLSGSPVRAKPRRRTAQRIPYLLDPEDARRLLELAGSMPDNPRAPLRGPSYKTIFALLYGLGLRGSVIVRRLLHCRYVIEHLKDSVRYAFRSHKSHRADANLRFARYCYAADELLAFLGRFVIGEQEFAFRCESRPQLAGVQ